MASFTIRFSGIDQLEGRLAALNAIRWQAVRKKQVAEMLNRARAAGGTPVDTGELRNSSGTSGEEVGYTKEYAPHVEYGHRTRGGGFVAGQKFLERNVNTQRSIYRKDLLDAIKKEGG